MIRLLKAKTGTARMETFEGREHVVVPVVALVEGVLWAHNAPTPELVLASNFEKSVMGWNGRPVVGDHPHGDDGNQLSANTPDVLQSNRFGIVFGAEVSDKKLKLEAWLDVDKAKQLGGEAQSVMDRIAAGDVIEVSVGVYVTMNNASGKYNGSPYEGVWAELLPDHLAMLPEDKTGACSVDMGCGAARAAAKGGIVAAKNKKVKEFNRPWRMETLAAEDMSLSDMEVRQQLDYALRATVIGYMGIDYVYPDESKVIYCVMPGDEYLMYERTYTAGPDGEMTLNDDEIQVKAVTTFVAAESNQEAQPTPRSACGCGGDKSIKAAEEVVMNRKDRVTALIATGRTSFKESHMALLEAMDEEAFKVLEAGAAAPAPVAEVVVPVPAVVTVEEPKQPTEAEFLSSHPELAAIVDRDRNQRAARRVELKAAMAATKQTAYTEVELEAMPLDGLEKLVKVASSAITVDHSLRGPRVAASNEEDVPAPPKMGDILAFKSA